MKKQELYKVIWEDGAPFSIAMPYKDADNMLRAAKQIWGNFFKIVKA